MIRYEIDPLLKTSCHDMRLSTRSGKWWAFDKFSNYEQATYATLREAIDAAMQK